jgi:hypothetical protein
MNSSIYPYSRGDLLENPNSYFYTEYKGKAFVEGWRGSRSTVLKSLPPARKPAPPGVCDTESDLSRDLLEQALAGDTQLAEKFVAKFEVTKRVHRGYDADFKALARDEHHEIELYLRAADLFARLYEISKSSRHLNVYLKCMDTLTGMAARMTPNAGARLAWHITCEEQYVSGLMSGMELSQ